MISFGEVSNLILKQVPRSLIQQIFIESLLLVRLCAKHRGYHSQQVRCGSTFMEVTFLILVRETGSHLTNAMSYL